MLTVPTRFPSPEDAGWRELCRAVAAGEAGSVMLGALRGPVGIELPRVHAAAAQINALQRLAPIPLLVGADFETGTAMRLSEGTSLPHPMAVAATGDSRYAYACGAITAREARAAGVNWIFAPLCDVNNNPANPIINTRSFGEDPRRVAEFAAEFLRGVEDHGVLATAKHFPGHGDTDIDSHIGLPVIHGDRARLERIELAPFRAAIRAKVSSVMTGHLLVPALEPNPELPATVSARILDRLLRRSMGFRGIIVTDSLDMAGVTLLYPPNRTAPLAIEAGADVLINPPSPAAALDSLRQAVRDRSLPLAKIDAAVRRVLLAKARLGLTKRPQADLDGLSRVFATAEFSEQALDIASRGITLLRDEDRLLPLDASKPMRALLLAISADPEPVPGDGFEDEIRHRLDSLVVSRADTRFALARNVDLPPAETYDIAIVALYVRVFDRKGALGLTEEQAHLVDRVLAAGKPVVVACFGSPYLVARFPQARAWIAAFSTTPVAERALGRALFGQGAIAGRLPVTVPGAAPSGAGVRAETNPMTLATAGKIMERALRPAFDLLELGVADRAFPGGVLAVAYKNRLVTQAFGRFTYGPRSQTVTPDTIYDVASLTKVVATTTLAMQMVEAGALRLDAPAALYLPQWLAGPQPEWRGRVTLGDLLRHSSGLPAHRKYYQETEGYEAILARVMAEPLVYEPGAKILYSDLGFILLGEIVRQVSGSPLDRLAHKQIFQPLGMTATSFSPPRRLRTRIAPTETDTQWRQRQICGEVHDQNASAMGGVAAHAGLFSTAGDLAAFCQMLLDGGIYAHRRLLARATIRQFTARQTIGDAAYGLGWDVPTGKSSSGHFFSPASFGHTGFTGTSLWIDPEKELSVVLLTNRVFPSAENDRIRRVRPALHDAVVRALGLAPRA